MPEPMILVQRRVCFYRAPTEIAVTVENVPVLVRNVSILITGPADVAILEQCGVSKDKGVRLIYAQIFDVTRKIVNVSFAASAIEPELDQVAVISSQLLQLRKVVFVVSGRILIFRLVPVPRRKIDAKFQSELSRCVKNLPHHIAMS